MNNKTFNQDYRKLEKNLQEPEIRKTIEALFGVLPYTFSELFKPFDSRTRIFIVNTPKCEVVCKWFCQEQQDIYGLSRRPSEVVDSEIGIYQKLAPKPTKDKPEYIPHYYASTKFSDGTATIWLEKTEASLDEKLNSQDIQQEEKKKLIFKALETYFAFTKTLNDIMFGTEDKSKIVIPKIERTFLIDDIGDSIKKMLIALYRLLREHYDEREAMYEMLEPLSRYGYPKDGAIDYLLTTTIGSRLTDKFYIHFNPYPNHFLIREDGKVLLCDLTKIRQASIEIALAQLFFHPSVLNSFNREEIEEFITYSYQSLCNSLGLPELKEEEFKKKVERAGMYASIRNLNYMVSLLEYFRVKKDDDAYRKNLNLFFQKNKIYKPKNFLTMCRKALSQINIPDPHRQFVNFIDDLTNRIINLYEHQNG
ncbi:hypothetical protein DRZ77_02065 [Candidatus Woesearchaeota archaeon]|nr:hypothetical protein [Candidatus Woesearchaeota archaeon]RLE40500.1 MAG: hypothetical protein DRZ77_02065 [Candidatus Woesearchaeota archaeon]